MNPLDAAFPAWREAVLRFTRMCQDQEAVVRRVRAARTWDAAVETCRDQVGLAGMGWGRYTVWSEPARGVIIAHTYKGQPIVVVSWTELTALLRTPQPTVQAAFAF